jgi:hypothetical protein
MNKHGAFGQVVVHASQNKVRKIPYSKDPTTKYVRSLENEAYILHYLTKKKVQCIPQYFGMRQTFQLQMQYLPIPQIDLRSYLKDLSLDQFHEFVRHCFMCLEALHRHVLHMDLHRDNIMFRRPTTETSYPQLVFIDFGFSVTLKDTLRNYPSSSSDLDVHALMERYKRHERYQLYGILLDMYEEQQQSSSQQTLERIEMLQRFRPSPRVSQQEREEMDEFHDTCYRIVLEGKWSHH